VFAYCPVFASPWPDEQWRPDKIDLMRGWRPLPALPHPNSP